MKLPKEMSGPAINRELEKLSKQSSELCDKFIAAGRGHERPSETLKLSDPLAVEFRTISDRRADLMFEARRRYGPDFKQGNKLPGPIKGGF